ncbi:MAG: universal stress protein [Lactobacillaceae bacterium]|jgi:nucleotide-binding universal stress UspA family protein|nr:universal stress protein [Lactobacillaceae bacterium]
MADLEFSKEPAQFTHILVGVDESEQGYLALENAIHQALEDESTLYIASVLELGDMTTFDAMRLDSIKAARQVIEDNLAKYKAHAIERGVANVETLFVDGAKVGEALVNDLATKVHADLIVVGAHSKQGFWGNLGSQAAYIAKHAHVTAMIARCC